MNKIIKSIFAYAMLAFVITICFSAIVMGQDVVVAQIPTAQFLEMLISSIGGIKGAGALGIAAIITKVLLAFANSELFNKIFSKLEGGVKLVIVLALSLASGFIALRISGVDWVAALIHSSTLSAFVVLSNQIYKQWFEKKKI